MLGGGRVLLTVSDSLAFWLLRLIGPKLDVSSLCDVFLSEKRERTNSDVVPCGTTNQYVSPLFAQVLVC